MENIIKYFEKDKFAEHLGIELLDAREGYAKAKMKINAYHFNSINTVHGGAIFALGDLVFSVAANTHEKTAMAINVSISYLKAATEGVLVAEVTDVTLKPKLVAYTIHITDMSNEIIAVFQGLAYRKRVPQ